MSAKLKLSIGNVNPPLPTPQIPARAKVPFNNRRLIMNTTPSSPFKSFITKGVNVRSRNTQSKDFAYDLSNDEMHFTNFNNPMKAVPQNQKDLLQSGQRKSYLASRYEHSPVRKYNFPEATSWRIGWFHNQPETQP